MVLNKLLESVLEKHVAHVLLHLLGHILHLREGTFAQEVEVRIERTDSQPFPGIIAQKTESFSKEEVDDHGLGQGKFLKRVDHNVVSEVYLCRTENTSSHDDVLF